MIIYKATNLVNGKIYIGKTTKSLNARRKQHVHDSARPEHGYAFHKAIIKYGGDAFGWEIVDRCLFEESLNELEKYYIKKFNSMAPMGYNLTAGGEGACGLKQSEETIAKRVLTYSGEKHWTRRKGFSQKSKEKMRQSHIGKKQSEETKRKRSVAMMGRTLSDETKAKISRSRLGKYDGENAPCFGRRWCHSLDTRAKMRESAMRRWYGENWKETIKEI